MSKICKETQALILQGQADENNRHVKTCTECVQFLNAHHDLSQHYDISAVTCPDTINFENIYQKANTKPDKKIFTLTNFSKIVALVACLILSIVVFPRNGQRINPNDYLNEIDQAFDDLNTSINSMEIELTNNQELLSVSAQEIENSLNFLQKEILE